MQCVIDDCNFIGRTEEEWVKHFKEKHPEIDTLRLGPKKINLREA